MAFFSIILKEHNLEYKNWYSAEKEQLKAALPAGSIARISHIGSTAVSGLLAKPTVDILLEIAAEAEVEIIESKLKETGWTLMHRNK